MYTLGFDYFQQGIKTGGDSIDIVMFGLGSVTVLAGTMLAATIITTLVFAKFMLAILLSVGPIFIVLMLFDGTRRLFEAWMAQLLGKVILLIIFGMAVNMVLMVLWSVLQTHFTVYMADRVLNLLGDIVAGSDITTSASAPSPASGLGIVLVCFVLNQFLSRVPAVSDSIVLSMSLNMNMGLVKK
jgi:type IV secretory pathway VirB6-like protein